MHTYWTSMLWSIDSCQNRESADQYRLTVSQDQVSTHRGQAFFEVIRWQVTSFQMIPGSSLIFFQIHMKYVVLMCRTITIFISNWPRTQKFSQLLKARKTDSLDFAHHDHSLVTVFVQFYAVIAQNLTGEFIRKIYAASWILFTLTGVWKSRKPE